MTVAPGPAGPPPPAPRVRLVVLNYNGGDDVVRSVEALAGLDWPAERREIVVVDNASTDGSDREVVRRVPEARLLRNQRNTGFPANNLALRDLDGIDYVGLVNLDAVVAPGWLAPLVAALEADPGLGAVTSRMLFAGPYVDVEVTSATFRPGRLDRRRLGVRVSGARVAEADVWRDVQAVEGTWGLEHGPDGPEWWTTDHALVRLPVGAAGPGRPATGALRLAAEAAKEVTLRSGTAEVTAVVGPEPEWVELSLAGEARDIVNNVGTVVYADGYGADRGFQEPAEGRYGEPEEVFAWSGGSVLLRPAYLDDVGLFDERFFLYYEDTDLAWRGRRRGWRYGYVPDAVVRHGLATSSGVATPTFQHYTERNRLAMLAKNAPSPMVARAIGRYLLATLSYARRDLVAPVVAGRRPRPEQVRRRLRSLAGFVRMAPALWRERRRLARTATVADADVIRGLTPR
jgi:GT2 family glycosyltransferase